MENKPTYQEALATLKDQIAMMLDQCDGSETPTLCRLLTIEGNKQLMIDSVIGLVKDGYETDQAISELERRYNPNTMDD